MRDGAPSTSSLAPAPSTGVFAALAVARHGYETAADLRGFVERYRAWVDDPQTAYYVSQALEECAALRVPATERLASWTERAASAELAAPCRGFEGAAIEPREIVELLARAARRGEPHAIARMLLFRDIAAPKEEVLDEIRALLATRDPTVVRDVGAFLSKGEAAWRFGMEDVPTAVAGIAWELAACDLGYACGPASRLVLGQCAFDGRCDVGYYEEALVRYEPAELMQSAQRVRAGILRALSERDWAWLGL